MYCFIAPILSDSPKFSKAFLTQFLILDVENVNGRMVVEQRVAAGASRLKENMELLTEISQKFGVPSQFLVAIWGIETK